MRSGSRPMRHACLAALAAAGLALAGCGHDRADREYLAALDGEERGMTRQEQIEHLDRAILLAPRRAYFYETRAGYRIDLKQFDRAMKDLDREIELLDRPYARYFRGLLFCQMGEFERSLPDFDLAIARDSLNIQFYRGRSLALAATGDARAALRDAERLVSRAPQRAESFYARGVALALLGRDRDAIADFDRAAALRPELVYVMEARAGAFERVGEGARARADREAAAALRIEQGGCAPCLDPFRY
jgi:tetratricopeptide (TPR) repeat protein